jgi:MFS family permease
MGVLRLREFRLLFGAQAVSIIGDRMVGIALAFAVLELGGSATEVGIVLAVRVASMVTTLLIGGVVADRLSRRAVMVAADISRLITQGAIALLLLTGTAEIWMLAVLSGATGAATGFFNPASTGLMPAIVPPDQIQQANGMRATALSGGEIAGPVIAGLLIAGLGAGWAVAIDALTFAISALFLARLHLPAHVARESGSFVADLREGWGVFTSLPWVWVFVVGAGIGNMLFGAWTALGPVIAEQDLGGAAAWGTVLGAVGFGAMVGALIAVRISPRRPLVLATVTFAPFALMLGLLAARAPVPVIAAGAVLGGAGMMLGNSVWESTLMRHVPHGSLSRVSAYDWFGSLAFQPLGLAIWGPIAAVVGLSPAVWLATAGLMATNGAMLCSRAIRGLREPRVGEDDRGPGAGSLELREVPK